MTEWIVRERFGAQYDRVVVPAPGTWLQVAACRDALSGSVFPVQVAPAMRFDDTDQATVALVCLGLAPDQELRLAPCDASADQKTVAVSTDATGCRIMQNGARRVKLPADGHWEAAMPGPLTGCQLGEGAWFGSSVMADVPRRASLWTEIESCGPCCVQWKTTYRWGGDAGFTYRVRWVAGSDTLLVEEDIFEDTDAAIEWHPFDTSRATSFVVGGGEGLGPMRELKPAVLAGASCGTGRRLLGRVSHISHFNQWNYAWVGFCAPGDGFAGVFSALGAQWQRRGHVRLEVWDDPARGHFLRCPIRRGQRSYGLVLSTQQEAGVAATDRRCLANRRKAQFSDLRLSKVLAWDLDPALEEHRPHLVRPEDLATFRERLATDPTIGPALACLDAAPRSKDAMELPLALWRNDAEALRGCVKRLLAFVQRERDVADGGYERLIIFDGRSAKSMAYELDVLWALKLVDEGDYRKVRACFLSLAYMFRDPDYTIFADYWPAREPEDSGMAAALQDDMGDCPVPPNFAAEFFTTTGVMAELFPHHPLSDEWRAWTVEQTQLFLEEFFSADGTYHESLNYHAHCFNEMLCLFYPWHINGVNDIFSNPRVKGSFQHFIDIRTPALATGIRPWTGAAPAEYSNQVRAAWELPRRVVMPCNGNSGSDGYEQDFSAELTVGAMVYRDRDPKLAGQLMTLWQESGKLVLDYTHAVLTLLTLDPAIPAAAIPCTSAWRQALGVFSRAQQADGAPLWCLFRAGHTTHHMCFDQGHLHLAAWDKVLLGDYGYHAHDSAGRALAACQTYLHNTVGYSDDPDQGSGYTGLEQAPEPALVHLGAAFDWGVHRIVNTNLRPCSVSYTQMVPVPTTIHVRHFLFVKPDYFIVWDVFEEAHTPSRFYLHPRDPMEALGQGRFRAGRVGEPHLVVQFILPHEPRVVTSEQLGPFWAFSVQNETAAPYLTLLVPQQQERGLTATFDAAKRVLCVEGDGLADRITLPPPGSRRTLPKLERKGH